MANPNPNKSTRFKKGVSGNPSGRKKGVSALVKSLSNDYEDYITMLDQWARDESLSVKERRECVKELLNRSLGMPTQAIHQTGDMSIIIGLPEDMDDNI